VWPPPLFRDHPAPVKVVVAFVIPALFGVLCGWLLGVSEPVYIALTLLGIGGGLSNGYEHLGSREGALRGLVGGVTFSSFILLTNELIGEEPKAELPDPRILLVVAFGAVGALLGAIGGRFRARRDVPA
jgi:hypothetical protein